MAGVCLESAFLSLKGNTAMLSQANKIHKECRSMEANMKGIFLKKTMKLKDIKSKLLEAALLVKKTQSQLVSYKAVEKASSVMGRGK